MALELRQQLKLAQKLVMTQQLRQAIKLLQLNRLELSGALQAEIEQNPALEEDTLVQDSSERSSGLSATDENLDPGKESDFTEKFQVSDNLPEINWEDYANNFDSNFSFARETPPADAPSQFDFISEKPDLMAYLQWQLAHCELDENEWDIALYIIGNFNRYGFLEIDLDSVCRETGCQLDDAEYVLEVIQDLDPPGIGARDVSESLYLQLERLGKGDSLAAEIVLNHLPLLQTRNYKMLARATGKKKPEIERAINYIISELTPFPGLPYATDDTNYIVPDVYVKKIDDEYVIQLNEDDLPQLKLSSIYQELLKNDKTLEKESKQYLNEKLKNADWFIKSLYQRQRTIYKVMESILKFQYDFFERGAEHLKPLILKDVAEDIDMHESTVSRVTSNKYVHTPQGIYELKFFFSTAIPREGGDAMASESIKTLIRKMIQDEDKDSPLSDNAIAQNLAEKNIKIARRTVAKYREQLKILPVKHRRHTK
ncbi:RNA polymerase factor sigma-54 [Desulforhopalus singaporensis]|uniref:RNA polymerase, sigma 54 subunit, RpoN/SigL n=1 Tax=Desulforhopalus singaporensis TaxID=91360 RepID=A0A1H0TTM3_9BACT|nr:RNA polymerase factor sigma-54 [Desulforhopalus singaporensis]SDP57313.1 RNA polymerase, sigma 54 subunit, RpoN/SigL [Desulforhopalus singaporensis]